MMKPLIVLIFLTFFSALCCGTASAQAQADSITVSPDKTDQPYTLVEQMPAYIGGNKALLNHLKKHFRGAASSQGLLVVSFVVHVDSTISDVAVLKVVDGVANEQVVQAIKSMSGQWTPGRQAGKLMKVRKVLPVRLPLTATSILEVEVSAAQ